MGDGGGGKREKAQKRSATTTRTVTAKIDNGHCRQQRVIFDDSCPVLVENECPRLDCINALQPTVEHALEQKRLNSRN
jgi:hypothetical protein